LLLRSVLLVLDPLRRPEAEAARVTTKMLLLLVEASVRVEGVVLRLRVKLSVDEPYPVTGPLLLGRATTVEVQTGLFRLRKSGVSPVN
jgi:hypothetical protein